VSKPIPPKNFADGSGYYESARQPGKVIGKIPGGDFIADPETGHERLFDSVNDVLAAIRAHKHGHVSTAAPAGGGN